MLKPAVIARILHKWLGLLVGLQILIWLASGLYMVVVDIDFIHGNSLVKNMRQTVVVPQAPVLETTARQIAKYHFDGNAAIITASLITTTPPDGNSNPAPAFVAG